MSGAWRGEVEDGLGWGGLVPTAAERRAEKAEQERRNQMEQLRAENARLRRALEDIVWMYDDALLKQARIISRAALKGGGA